MEQTHLALATTDSALVTVGTRAISIRGFTTNGFYEHLSNHLTDGRLKGPWCDMGCAARFLLRRDSPANRNHVRARLSSSFSQLLSRGVVVIIEYAKGGKAHACRLHVGGTAEETQATTYQLHRMHRRGEITMQKAHRVSAITGIPLAQITGT